MSLPRLTETAVLDWLGLHPSLAPLPRLHADEDAERAFPCLVVRAVSEGEHISGTGVFKVAAQVMLFAQADDTRAEDLDQLWRAVEERLLWDELAAELSKTPGFLCYGVTREAPLQRDSEERVRVWSCPLTLFACLL